MHCCLLKDVKAAAHFFGELREARKEGGELKVVKPIPILNYGAGLYDTVEGSVLHSCGIEIREVQKAFRELPYNVRQEQAFAPKNGEFVERARFWNSFLTPILTPEQRRKAMVAILRWYMHIKRLAKDRN